MTTFDHTSSEHAILTEGIGEISNSAKCYYLHHFIGGDVRSLLRTISFSLSVMCLAHPARAVTADEDMRRNGLVPSLPKGVRIATFACATDSRLYFFDDTDRCPSSGAKPEATQVTVARRCLSEWGDS